MSRTVSITAKPYAFVCDLDRTVYLVIDMQREFLSPGGFAERLGNAVSVIRRCIAPSRHLLDASRQRGVRFIHTREGHLPDLSDCPAGKARRMARQGAGIDDDGPLGRLLIRGEKGNEIIAELAPMPGETVIDKPSNGAFFATDLQLILEALGVRSLIAAGVTTHVCVSSTVREASDRGLDCLVLSDCTAAYDPRDHEAALWQIRQQGAIFGWVTESGEVLAALGATCNQRGSGGNPHLLDNSCQSSDHRRLRRVETLTRQWSRTRNARAAESL